jgi:hypothetical protein
MQRIVKRFLLHKQRENDEVNEMDLSELKQDLQMIRYEFNNDERRSKQELKNLLNHIDSGIKIIGQQMFRNSVNSDELTLKFQNYISTGVEEIDLKTNPIPEEKKMDECAINLKDLSETNVSKTLPMIIKRV